MPRRLQQTFHCAPLSELTRQLLFAPPAKRIEQLHRTERLHDEIDTNTPYPIEYLVYRITGYRRDASDESELLVGEAVQPDLRLIIDQLSRSVDLPADDEPAVTVPEAARELNVSSKTINRWRRAGLRWRWVVPRDQGQRHIVIPRSALERFTDHNASRVARARRFTPLGEKDQQYILERAGQIVRRAGAASAPTLNQVAAEVARETDRALETVRLILEKHDRQHPQRALFYRSTGPLSARQKRVIERAYRRGIAACRLAERFGRSRATIHRIIHQRRAAAARHVALEHVHSPTFDRDDADQVILRDAMSEHTRDAEPGTPRVNVPVEELPEALRPLYRQPAIDAARQRSWFIRYNYLKHKADRVRAGFDRYEPRAAELDHFEALVDQVRQVRQRLVRANLPVVLSVARRHLIGEHRGRGTRLLELLETGQQVLIEAVESYNASWSHTFTSYLTNRLLKHFAQDDDHASRQQARRRLSSDQMRQRLVDHLRAHHIELDAPAKATSGESG